MRFGVKEGGREERREGWWDRRQCGGRQEARLFFRYYRDERGREGGREGGRWVSDMVDEELIEGGREEGTVGRRSARRHFIAWGRERKRETKRRGSEM